MKVLHLSHHYGCLKDHQYVCEKLKINLESVYSGWNTILPSNSYSMSREMANDLWIKHKDHYNQYDYILTSDTASISRIFLQNLEELKPKLIVWICNRFNYALDADQEYFDLFKRSYQDKVRFIPYTEFERLWASIFGVSISEEVIRPIGKSSTKKLSTLETNTNIGLIGDAVSSTDGKIDFFVSRYHNDNLFQNTVEIFKSYGVSAKVAQYNGPQEIKKLAKKCEGFFFLPEQYSKLATFEFMNNYLPVVLPSKEFLVNLSMQPNYWFGSGLNSDTVNLCEWYNEYYQDFAVYINNFGEIVDALELIKTKKSEMISVMEECSQHHINKTLNQWRNVYDLA